MGSPFIYQREANMSIFLLFSAVSIVSWLFPDSYLHNQNIIHRDLKSLNIFIHETFIDTTEEASFSSKRPDGSEKMETHSTFIAKIGDCTKTKMNAKRRSNAVSIPKNARYITRIIIVDDGVSCFFIVFPSRKTGCWRLAFY